MTNFHPTQVLLSLVFLLVSTVASGQECDCRIERVGGEIEYSAGCATPENICSLTISDNVDEVNLATFTDLRGIKVMVGKNAAPTFHGSTLCDRKTQFNVQMGANINIIDSATGEQFSYALTNATKFTSTQTLNKLLNACDDTCTLVAPSIAASFSSFLPVTLLSFDGEAVRRGVELGWETELETDNDYFALLRSSNGVDFEEITRLPGSGSTEGLSTYHYFDAAAAPGLNYYRLEQVDLDGTRTVLGIRQIETAGGATRASLTVSPNPATVGGRVRLSLDNPAGTTVRVVDLAGRPITNANLDAAGAFQVPTGLQPGMYVVVVGNQATRLVVRP